MTDSIGLEWVPDACTLPTAEQPLRVAEFDDLFATALRDVTRGTPTTLHLGLDQAAHSTALELTARESECCSFFSFGFLATDDRTITLEISVPAAHTAVLDALADRAGQASGRA